MSFGDLRSSRRIDPRAWRLGLAVLLALTACAYKGPAKKELLEEEQTAAYRARGTSVIEGQVIVPDRSSPWVPAANLEIRLMPVTTASSTYMETVALVGGYAEPKQFAGELAWVQTTDAEGRFRFADLPPGEYYLTCIVSWLQGDGKQKGIAYAKVKLGTGDKVDVQVKPGASAG